MMRPSLVSISSIRPGCSRPLYFTSSGLIGSTPHSDDSTTKPSLVTQ